MNEDELRAENDRMRRALLGIAGCVNCSVCKEVAFKIVGTPWKPIEASN